MTKQRPEAQAGQVQVGEEEELRERAQRERTGWQAQGEPGAVGLLRGRRSEMGRGLGEQ